MARPSQQEGILDAALACFAAFGYDGTRVRMIAERAGVTEGALYRHFTSKEALATALYTRFLRGYAATLTAIAHTDRSVRDRLQDCIRVSLMEYRTHTAAVTFVLLRPSPFAAISPPDIALPLEIIESILREGQAQGIIRTGPANLLAAIFMGCFLRPAIMSLPGATEPEVLNIHRDTGYDEIIIAAAWDAVQRRAD